MIDEIQKSKKEYIVKRNLYVTQFGVIEAENSSDARKLARTIPIDNLITKIYSKSEWSAYVRKPERVLSSLEKSIASQAIEKELKNGSH